MNEVCAAYLQLAVMFGYDPTVTAPQVVTVSASQVSMIDAKTKRKVLRCARQKHVTFRITPD